MNKHAVFDDDISDLFGYVAPPIAPAYPTVPGFKGDPDGPSAQAAKAIAPTITGLRRDVLNFLRNKAAAPLTADQIAVQLGRSPFSIRPRVTELYRFGLIEPAAERGKNESGMTANRWRAVALVNHDTGSICHD